ncbi:GNAT family N-acetyltransferase [Ornithinibacillus sp. BX22]|uniref:GNAT family N-acetyltransferase n=1 Tax=Ornithinibacillus hominis TaxID=2763055 RepID=A0A923L6C2_9BACI|nr:GNAT family protein [Ornithinibacillus hominis]MBC5637317.1 GNAT family N-acetyltransferase [Ornithinibacillus hominis]
MYYQGKSVYLRPLTKEDNKSILNAVHDEEIRYMTGTRNMFTMEQINAQIDRILEDDSRYDFAICLVEADGIIGDLTILDIDKMNRKAGFRIALHDKKYFNKGYGTEAVELALAFTFKELKLNRLQLEVYSHNKRGIKAYEKVGFKVEGVLRDSLFYNEAYSDEIIMGILAEDYFRRQKTS